MATIFQIVGKDVLEYVPDTNIDFLSTPVYFKEENKTAYLSSDDHGNQNHYLGEQFSVTAMNFITNLKDTTIGLNQRLASEVCYRRVGGWTMLELLTLLERKVTSIVNEEQRKVSIELMNASLNSLITDLRRLRYAHAFGNPLTGFAIGEVEFNEEDPTRFVLQIIHDNLVETFKDILGYYPLHATREESIENKSTKEALYKNLETLTRLTARPDFATSGKEGDTLFSDFSLAYIDYASGSIESDSFVLKVVQSFVMNQLKKVDANDDEINTAMLALESQLEEVKAETQIEKAKQANAQVEASLEEVNAETVEATVEEAKAAAAAETEVKAKEEKEEFKENLYLLSVLAELNGAELNGFQDVEALMDAIRTSPDLLTSIDGTLFQKPRSRLTVEEVRDLAEGGPLVTHDKLITRLVNFLNVEITPEVRNQRVGRADEIIRATIGDKKVDIDSKIVRTQSRAASFARRKTDTQARKPKVIGEATS